MQIRKTTSIDNKIEQARENVIKCKNKYDAAVKELSGLQEKKKAIQDKDLLEAFEKGSRSYEETIAFLTTSNEG